MGWAPPCLHFCAVGWSGLRRPVPCYYIQSMEIPTDIVEWIDSDVQQLLWGKGGGLHAEEAGSNDAFHRWMIDGAQYTPRRWARQHGIRCISNCLLFW